MLNYILELSGSVIDETLAAIGPYSAIASRGSLSCDTQSGSPYLVGLALN